MKVCIPVEEFRGLNSTVYGHFGSAPVFALVDTDTLAIEPLANHDEHHQHGMCSPVKAVGSRPIDAVIVGGMGAGAVRGLQAVGIAVFRFTGGTVGEAVEQFNAGELPVLTLQHACGGHSHGETCGHENHEPAS
ncbi:MAG: hypothetical protein PCFJNLEI_00356 [Verrucomicrobiae bacterium]|nr:hypothetical protein [Verrucomicrobiae bacterium]